MRDEFYPEKAIEQLDRAIAKEVMRLEKHQIISVLSSISTIGYGTNLPLKL